MIKKSIYWILVFFVVLSFCHAQNSSNSTINISENNTISLNISINETNQTIINETEPINNTNSSNETVETPPSNESRIEILEIIPGNISFGEEIQINTLIYKGNTRKYVVKASILGVSNESKVNVYGKYLNLFHNFSLAIVDNSDCNHNSGNYTIFIEGLGTNTSKNVFVQSECDVEEELVEEELEEEPVEENEEQEEEYERKVIFYISEFPETISVNESFITKVKFFGNYEDHEVKIFSYVYKSSVAYSGEREENIKEFSLEKGTEKTVSLENTLLKYGEDLKFKIKILFDDRKTYDEITREVKTELIFNEESVTEDEEFDEEEIEEIIEILSESKIYQPSSEPDSVNLEKDTVYRSKSLRSLDIALYAIIGILIILLSYMLFKKGI